MSPEIKLVISLLHQNRLPRSTGENHAKCLFNENQFDNRLPVFLAQSTCWNALNWWDWINPISTNFHCFFQLPHKRLPFSLYTYWNSSVTLPKKSNNRPRRPIRHGPQRKDEFHANHFWIWAAFCECRAIIVRRFAFSPYLDSISNVWPVTNKVSSISSSSWELQKAVFVNRHRKSWESN